jgi:DNA polymerase
MMTAVNKQSIAKFLDISADYISTGFYGEEKEYKFEDEKSDKIAEPPKEEPNTGDSIEKIAKEVKACTGCALCKERTNAAPGEGSHTPLVMVIGEGPGAEEDAQGRPFVGRAGQLLDKMLGAIDLSRNTNCFIANVVKCRPPQNRDPHPEETAACAHFLERQIGLLRPKFILVVGRIAAQNLLKTTEPVNKLRGKFTEFKSGDLTIPLFVTYHPAAILRNDELRRPAWEDLKLLRARINGEN